MIPPRVYSANVVPAADLWYVGENVEPEPVRARGVDPAAVGVVLQPAGYPILRGLGDVGVCLRNIPGGAQERQRDDHNRRCRHGHQPRRRQLPQVGGPGAEAVIDSDDQHRSQDAGGHIELRPVAVRLRGQAEVKLVPAEEDDGEEREPGGRNEDLLPLRLAAKHQIAEAGDGHANHEQ